MMIEKSGCKDNLQDIGILLDFLKRKMNACLDLNASVIDAEMKSFKYSVQANEDLDQTIEVKTFFKYID